MQKIYVPLNFEVMTGAYSSDGGNKKYTQETGRVTPWKDNEIGK